MVGITREKRAAPGYHSRNAKRLVATSRDDP